MPWQVTCHLQNRHVAYLKDHPKMEVVDTVLVIHLVLMFLIHQTILIIIFLSGSNDAIAQESTSFERNI